MTDSYVIRVALLAAGALAGGAVSQAPELVLTDVTRAVGIGWVQVDNNTMMGAGGAFLDFDGDGWLDVLLAGGDATPGLYRNVRGGTAFVPVTPSPFQVSAGREYMCVTVADIDNDGDPDVFFGRFGPNLLYRNDGGGAFTDITTPEIAGGQHTFTTTAAFGDYDADGNLDLYVGNYIAPGSSPPRHTPMPNALFRGRGDGTFTDVTDPVVAGAGTALATTWTDFDADGDADLWLANDFGATVEPNQVYRNDGPSAAGHAFTERAAQLRADLRMYCMGIAIGDCDRDGDLDYYFTNLGRNALLRNDGSAFTDIATSTGTELTFDIDTSPRLLATSWGTGFHDFDNDGWLDLYVSNGHIPSDPALANGLRTRNVLFRHDGPAMTFSRVNLALDDGIGRGVAFGDYDNDGDVDVLQMNVAGPPALLRNDSPRRGHWLAARLRGRLSNRDALGARVDVDVGSFVSCREVSRNDSFESSSQARLHFGLGSEGVARRAHVTWPSGVRQTVHDLPADREYALVEPLVTVQDARLRTLDLRIGELLLFQAEITNQSGAPVTAVFEPQVRAGYAAAPRFGAPGSTLWRGDPRPVRLSSGRRRPVLQVLFLPNGIARSGSLNLDFVWAVVDAEHAVDEAKTAIR